MGQGTKWVGATRADGLAAWLWLQVHQAQARRIWSKNWAIHLTMRSFWTCWSNWAVIRIKALNAHSWTNAATDGSSQLKKTKNTEVETLPAASYWSDEHQSQHQLEDVAADSKANQAARCDHPLHLTGRMAKTHLWSTPHQRWTIDESSTDCTFSKSKQKNFQFLLPQEYKNGY